MTIERRRPLPVGRYWADIFPAQQPKWGAWISVQRNAGNASIEATEHFDAIGDSEAHDFVIWNTTAETIWPDDEMGFLPNVAGPGIRSSADTVQRPEPEPDALGRIDAWGKSIGRAIVTAGAVAGGVLVLFGLLSLAKRRRYGGRT